MANTNPVARMDIFDGRSGIAPGSVNLLTNDGDADGDTLVVSSIDTTGTAGTVSVLSNGTFSFTPTAGFTGITRFTYTVSDGAGGTATAEVVLTVFNEAPTARDDTFAGHGAVSGNLLANDSDADGDAFSLVNLDQTGTQGTVTAFADGSFEFIGNAGFSGVTSFSYTIRDALGATSTAQVLINMANEAPVAQSDTVNARGGTVSGTFSLLANDIDSDGDPISLVSVDTSGLAGTLNVAADGTFTYQAAAGFKGTDYFTYVVEDSYGAQSTGQVALAVTNVFIGTAGNNVIKGSTEADFMRGRAGNDTYIANHALDFAFEVKGGGNDRILAETSYTIAAGQAIEALKVRDPSTTIGLRLTGNEFDQNITGNVGNNRIDGGLGADRLTGLNGDDKFVFSTALGSGNVDTITDFAPGDDRILLDDAVFAGIGPAGPLSSAFLVLGTAAADADDRIIYNPLNGRLFYDADGNGAGARVQFAEIGAGLSLQASDIFVI